MAGIEKIIDDLVFYVFEATMDQFMTELFSLRPDESEEDFARRMEYSEDFMQSNRLTDLYVEKLDNPNGTFQVMNKGSGASILLSNPRAMETDLLSDNFLLLIETVKSRDDSKTLYEAIKYIISDVELSPLVSVLRKQVVEDARIKTEVWDKFIAHLIVNKDLCHKENKAQLKELYKNLNKTVAEFPVSKAAQEKERIRLKDEFIGLMQQLSIKISDLKERGEINGAVAATALKIELISFWQNFLRDQDPNAFKQACDDSIAAHEPELNDSRGGKWKQWFADWGNWFLRLIACGFVDIEDTKITTDTMGIVLDIKQKIEHLAIVENRFFIPAQKLTVEENVVSEELLIEL